VGDMVIKIFYPLEAGEAKERDKRQYTIEIAAMEHAREAGILVPDLVCTGMVRDELYTFNYTVMKYIEGTLASNLILKYSDYEKVNFVSKFKEITNKLHVPNPGLNIPCFDEPERINSVLWDRMPQSFREDRLRYLANTAFPEPVVCHGDLGGGHNIIIDKEGYLHLIDFAESSLSPYYYDMPLVFGHGRDRILMEAYYGDYQNDKFYDMFTLATLLVWFGEAHIKWLSERIGFDFTTITSVDALRDMLIKMVGGN